MPSYDELVDLARLCQHQARLASGADVARELRRMAVHYREQAGKLHSGKLPEIDDEDDGKPVI